MMPNVSAVFADWTSRVQMKVIKKVPLDFELKEETLQVVEFEAVMQPMPPQKVDRKPEGERAWKWWEAWSTLKLQRDTIVQDMDGLQFRVQSVQDWSQAGFYHYDMTEQPPEVASAS